MTIRPLAGTRPRGETPEADRALEAELLAVFRQQFLHAQQRQREQVPQRVLVFHPVHSPHQRAPADGAGAFRRFHLVAHRPQESLSLYCGGLRCLLRRHLPGLHAVVELHKQVQAI